VLNLHIRGKEDTQNMKRSVSRYDIAVKVSADKKEVIENIIPEVEKKYKISLNARVHKDPEGKGFVVTCIQGLKVPQYKVSDAIMDLTTCIRAKCRIQTAVINKSTCQLDEACEKEDIAKLLGYNPPKNLISNADKDNLFDSKAYAGDIPSERVVEILLRANQKEVDDTYAYLDAEGMAEKAEAGAKIEAYFEEKGVKSYE
jgi:hypothetical protein